jgi:hypothetical protein
MSEHFAVKCAECGELIPASQSYPASTDVDSPPVCYACGSGKAQYDAPLPETLDTTGWSDSDELIRRGRSWVIKNVAAGAVMNEDERLLISRLCDALEYTRDAIRTHRSQHLDDRCWMDDQELYAVLGDGDLGDNSTPDKAKMLENCSRFIDQRCKPGEWKSYQELEAEVAALRAERAPEAEMLDWLEATTLRRAAEIVATGLPIREAIREQMEQEAAGNEQAFRM